jgi:RNase P/RNase MRP subunit p29
MIILGKRVTIVAATNPELIGLTGEVIADNRDTITLRNNDGEEKLLVKHILTLEVEGRTVAGADLRGIAATRLKR